MSLEQWLTTGGVLIAVAGFGVALYAALRNARHDDREEESAAVAALREELRDARAEMTRLREELKEYRQQLEQAQRDRRALQDELTKVLVEIRKR